MKNKELDTTQKNSDLSTASSLGSLLSFDEMDSFFDDFLSRKWPRKPAWRMTAIEEPNILRVDIIEHENDIEVQAALPGFKKDNIEISINHQTITIRTLTEQKNDEEKDKYSRREIMRGEFLRTLTLPDTVDGDKAQASFTDGILKIIIPKSEKNKRKTIEIQ